MEDIYDKIPNSLSFVKSTFLILVSCLIAFKKVTYRQPTCTSRALAHFFSTNATYVDHAFMCKGYPTFFPSFIGGQVSHQ